MNGFAATPSMWEDREGQGSTHLELYEEWERKRIEKVRDGLLYKRKYIIAKLCMQV